MSCRGFLVVTGMVFILLLSGCGRKTALVPPQKLVPVRIDDLRYVLDERGVTLKWTYPTKMENGDELRAIESFAIYRAVIPEKDYCPGCPVRYEEPVEIDGGPLSPAGDARFAVYSEENLQTGYHYLYKVRSRAGGWYESGDSNVVSFVWTVPPKAPEGLQIDAGDRSLALRWDPVTETIDAQQLHYPIQYQVYRRSGDEDYAPQGEPVQKPEFFDAGLINDKLYWYRVRALAVHADSQQAGGASKAVSGMPRDLTPPPQPQHLAAIEVPAGVKLAWPAVAGEDLAGYRIYRRGEDVGTAAFIAEVGPGQNQYIDRSVTPGMKWFYTVTSFDTAQPGNESLPSEEEVVDLR